MVSVIYDYLYALCVVQLIGLISSVRKAHEAGVFVYAMRAQAWKRANNTSIKLFRLTLPVDVKLAFSYLYGFSFCFSYNINPVLQNDSFALSNEYETHMLFSDIWFLND